MADDHHPGQHAQRIKVVHIITGLAIGGTELMLLKLLAAMDREKFACHVISLTNQGVVGDKIQALGISVVTMGMKNGIPDPIGFTRLLSTLKKLQPDVVQTWLYHADLLGGLAAKYLGIKNVVWNIRQSNLDKKLNKWHTLATARTCAFLSGWLAKKIICNSQTAALVHQRLGYRKELFQLIGNGFDLEKFQPAEHAKAQLCNELKISQRSLLVGIVARFDPQKDHQNFIKAADLVLRTVPTAHFILVGSGVDRKNQMLAVYLEQTTGPDHFHLLGERHDIPRILAALDIACSSSLGEGFPNAVGEAMACEVPCVVTDAGDSAIIVGPTGVVVAPGDALALAQGIIGLLQDSASGRLTLGKQARLQIKKNYSLSAIAQEYATLYARLAATEQCT
jgi:glycosyltransferase involved in cell wall biosynthesis